MRGLPGLLVIYNDAIISGLGEMGFIDAIVSLLRDPRSAIAAAIAAGPFAA